MQLRVMDTGEIGTVVQQNETQVLLSLPTEAGIPPRHVWFFKHLLEKILLPVAVQIIPGIKPVVDAVLPVVEAVVGAIAKRKRKVATPAKKTVPPAKKAAPKKAAPKK